MDYYNFLATFYYTNIEKVEELISIVKEYERKR